MTAKQYLSQLRWLDREIQTSMQELEELRARAEGCSAKEITGMPGGSGSQDRMADTIAKIIDLERYIEKKIIRLCELQRLIVVQIDGMPDSLHRSILHKKYVLMQSWPTIADELCYSEPSCYRLHGIALKEFSRIYHLDRT